MDPLRLTDISLIACVHALLTEHADYASEIESHTDTNGFEERTESPVETEVIEMEEQLVRGFQECLIELKHELADQTEENNELNSDSGSHEDSTVTVNRGSLSDKTGSDKNLVPCSSSKIGAKVFSSDINTTISKTTELQSLSIENSKEQLTAEGHDEDKDYDESLLPDNELGSQSVHTTNICTTHTTVAWGPESRPSGTDSRDRSMYLTRMLETGCFTAVSEDILKRMVKYCPLHITSRLLKALVPPYAKELHLHGCTTIRLMALVDVFQRCRHLKHLNLVQCSQVIHPDLFTVVQLYNLPLTTVILEENSGVNDEVIHSMIRNLPNLTTLNVSSCSNISNKAFLVYEDEQLGREVSPCGYKSTDAKFSSLTNVDVSGCKTLSTGLVQHLVSLAGPTLQHVNISWTSVDCLSLLFLAGYSMPAVITFLLADRVLKTDRELIDILEQYRFLGVGYSDIAIGPGKEKPVDPDDSQEDLIDEDISGLIEPVGAKGSATTHRENDTLEMNKQIRKSNVRFLDTKEGLAIRETENLGQEVGYENQCLGYGHQLEHENEETDEQIFRDLVDHVQDIGDNFLEVISEIEAANLFGAHSLDSEAKAVEEDKVERTEHTTRGVEFEPSKGFSEKHLTPSEISKKNSKPVNEMGALKMNTWLKYESENHVVKGDRNGLLKHTVVGQKSVDMRTADIDHIDIAITEKSRDSVSDSGIFDSEESILTNCGGKRSDSPAHDFKSENIGQSENDGEKLCHPNNSSTHGHNDCRTSKFVHNRLELNSRKLGPNPVDPFRNHEQSSCTADGIWDTGSSRKPFHSTCKQATRAKSGDFHLSHSAAIDNCDVSISAVGTSMSVIGTAKMLEPKQSTRVVDKFHSTVVKSTSVIKQVKVSDEESPGLGNESDEVSDADDDYECDLDSCEGVKEDARLKAGIMAEANTHLESGGPWIIPGTLTGAERHLSDDDFCDLKESKQKEGNRADLNDSCEGIDLNDFEAYRDDRFVELDQRDDVLAHDLHDEYGLENLEIDEIDSEVMKGTENQSSEDKKPEEPFALNLSYDELLFKPQIQSLDITGMKFLGMNPYLGQSCLRKFLQVNTTLQRFSVSWKGLSFDCFKKMVLLMEDLRDIELYDCTMLQNPGVQALGLDCPKLEGANLRGVVFISDYALLPYLKLEYLNKLSLAESDHITDRILKLVATHLPGKLTDLDISWCEEITEKGVNAICESCYKLKRLMMRKCPVSDMSLRLLGETALNLETLSVETVDPTDDTVFTRMAGFIIGMHLKKLRVLDISWNLAIVDDSVGAILRGCNQLEEAYFKGLKCISIDPFLPMICDNETSIQRVLQPANELPYRSSVYAPNLRVLDLDYCDLINDQLLQRLVNVCRGTLHVTDYYSIELEAA